jgi:hypothetical protein
MISAICFVLSPVSGNIAIAKDAGKSMTIQKTTDKASPSMRKAGGDPSSAGKPFKTRKEKVDGKPTQGSPPGYDLKSPT